MRLRIPARLVSRDRADYNKSLLPVVRVNIKFAELSVV